jgi:hypothetical protein
VVAGLHALVAAVGDDLDAGVVGGDVDLVERVEAHPAERFNDTFDKRFFRQERFTERDQLAERAGAFEAFHNSQHRYQATNGRAPDETAPAPRRDPLGVDEVPAGWPPAGRIEFIRFIRSDHKLRLLGRAIPMPDGTAYQYLTATLDLALADQDNLLVSNDQGELITTARLPHPGR